MTRPNAPMYVILSTEGMTQAQADEINQLTRELAKSLESHSGSIESVSLGGKNDLPQDPKLRVLETLLTEQVVVCIAPIVANWVLGKIDATIKSISAHLGTPVKATVIVNNREVQISPKTTAQELVQAAQQLQAADKLSQGRRLALIIGNSSYRDERLPDLKSAVVDAERFAAALADPNSGSPALYVKM